MRRRDAVGVEDFTVRGATAVKILAVPGGDADRVIIRILLRDIDAAGDRIGLADMIGAAAFGDRLTGLDEPLARRHSVRIITGAIREQQTYDGASDEGRKPPDCYADATPHRPQSHPKMYGIPAW